MKKRFFCFLFAIIMLFVALSLRISTYYSTACEAYAENGIKGKITQEINKALAEEQLQANISYETISKITYLSDGRIGSIIIDTAKVNLLATELSNAIYDCINRADNSFGIPFGNVLGHEFTSGKGPKIGVDIVPVGAVIFEINSELISGGINQTLHRISIRFETVISCVAPFHESKNSISTTITVAETLIVGEIPNVMLPTGR